MNIPAKTTPPGDLIADLVKGDLSKLSGEQRAKYYVQVCQSLGLNPLTKPFDFLQLQGKLILYPNRTCADQLRKLHGVSLTITEQKVTNDVLVVRVRARDRDGREDEDMGAVPFPDTLRGEARANQILKAVTKAKRRATLSISGLGWIDESEIEGIPDAQPVEIDDEIPESGEDDRTHDEIDAELAEAAEQGMLALERQWHTLSKSQQATFKQALDRRYKLTAQHADAERENAADPVQQAGIRCADPRFHKFLEETNTAWKIMTGGTPTERAAELVRAICGVKSRKDITPGSEAAEHWHDLEGRFQAWLRA